MSIALVALALLQFTPAACLSPGTSLLQGQDKVFSQCLVALATAFSHQLLAAVQGHLNPEPEYGQSTEDISAGWLGLLASKGVLLHVEANMSGKEVTTTCTCRCMYMQLYAVQVYSAFPEEGDEHIGWTGLHPQAVEDSTPACSCHGVYTRPEK